MRILVALATPILWFLPAAATADVQAQRSAFMREMIQLGVFSKYEKPARFCRAYTGPRWASLPYDQKSQFANVVLSWCYTADREANILIIRDGFTGKDIGDYSTITGRLKLH